MKLIVLGICFLTFLEAQTISGTATTRGACSPANSGNSNTFNIVCGIGKEQGEKMLAILNKVLTNQIDPTTVLEKLDEIQKGVTEINERSAPRAIREQDAKAMIHVLSQQPPQKVNIYFLSANEEARRLAERIRAILLDAGWQCEAPNTMMPFRTGPLPGIQVELAAPKLGHRRYAASPGLILLKAIQNVGLHIQGNFREDLPTNTIKLHVYGKPLQP